MLTAQHAQPRLKRARPRGRWSLGAAFTLLVGWTGTAAAAPQSTCFSCHTQPDIIPSEHSTRHAMVPCSGCHAGYAERCLLGKLPPPTPGTLSASVAVKAPRSPNAAAACEECHQKEFAAYRRSIHGTAFLGRGKAEAAYCFDCHGGPHALGHTVGENRADDIERMVDRCVKCHDDEHLIEKNALRPDVVKTYRDSIHGKSLALNDSHSASCFSCHGSHEILPASDPRSLVSAERVVATCASCHEGADASFATSFAHRALKPKVFLVGWIIQQAFVWLTMLTMAFLGGMAGLDAFHAVRMRLGAKKGDHP